MEEKVEYIASHPGQVKAKTARIFLYHPKFYFIWGLPFIIVLAWAFYSSSIWIGLLAVIIAIPFLIYIINTKAQFAEGDVNLAKIIRPGFLAVPVNLRMSMEGPEYAAVKIIRHRVPKIDGHPANVGDYTPTVSFYVEGKDLPHWKNVRPIPMTVGTSDKNIIDYHLDDLRWQPAEIERRLSLLPENVNIGLHKLDDDELQKLRGEGDYRNPTELFE